MPDMLVRLYDLPDSGDYMSIPGSEVGIYGPLYEAMGKERR